MQITVHRELPQRPTLGHNHIDVWCWTYEQLIPLDYEWERLLLMSERRQATRFHTDQDRCRYILTRGMVRHLLSRYLRCLPADLFLTADANNTLNLHDSDLRFEFAAAGDVITIAVAHQLELGVQVEAMEALPELDKLAQFMLNSAETKRYRNLHQRQKLSTFYNLWTRKSALFKTAHTPTAHFDQLHVWDQTTFHCDAPNATLHVRTLDLLPSYSGAIAYRLPLV